MHYFIIKLMPFQIENLRFFKESLKQFTLLEIKRKKFKRRARNSKKEKLFL